MYKTIKLFEHLFVPHQSNNQRAKILHSSGLSAVIFVVIGFQIILNIIPKTFPSVLGYASNISPGEVIRLVNEQRVANGLSPLTENKTLDGAALAKGQDMLAKGYWAHFAPDGTSPWTFFLKFGYKYQYAGENLARDFSSAQGAMNAWMNSATHKENILNPRYKETGIGVVEGSMGGTDTTIIVQFFGAPLIGKPSIPIAKAETVAGSESVKTPPPSPTPEPTLVPVPVIVAEISPQPTSVPVTSGSTRKISPFKTTRDLSLAITGIILLVLSVDLIIVKRQRIVRIGGRTLAHLAYLSMVLAVVLILKAGQII